MLLCIGIMLMICLAACLIATEVVTEGASRKYIRGANMAALAPATAESPVALGGARAKAVSPSDCAWVTLVMRGAAYVPGALALAASLRGTRAARVCMITEDVPRGARELLAAAFDRVVPVPVISFRTCPMRTEKQNAIYGSWIADGYTKWNCLALSEYARVCFLDADTVVVGNCDSLFELPAPAGIFSSPWGYPYSERGAGLPNHYWHGGPPAHGSPIRDIDAIEGLRNSFTAFGTTMLLTPGEGLLASYEAYCAAQLEERGCVGERGCYNGADEQTIVGFFLSLAAGGAATAPAATWHHIDQRYGDIPWHPRWQEAAPAKGRGAKKASAAVKLSGRILHYHGRDKIWTLSPDKWPDAVIWWKYAVAAVAANPAAEAVFDYEYLVQARAKLAPP
jgi:hypothetical protein